MSSNSICQDLRFFGAIDQQSHGGLRAVGVTEEDRKDLLGHKKAASPATPGSRTGQADR